MTDCKFKEKEAPRLLQAVLTDPKHLLFIFAAYVYLSGFIYAYYYYNFFGLPFSAGDVPAYNMFVYAVNVFLRVSIVSIFTLVLLVGVAAYNWLQNPPRGIELSLLIGLVAFAPVVFYDSGRLARSDAADSREGRRSMPKVSLVLKDDHKALYSQLPGWTKAIETGQLRLIAQNTDYLYLLFQEYPDEGNLPAMRVYWVKREDAAAMEILVNRKKQSS